MNSLTLPLHIGHLVIFLEHVIHVQLCLQGSNTAFFSAIQQISHLLFSTNSFSS